MEGVAPLRHSRSERAARRALACSLLAAGLAAAAPANALAAPASVTVRSARQRSEQVTSLTAGGSGVPTPPPFCAEAAPAMSAAQVAARAATTVAVRLVLTLLAALKYASLGRAYGVS